MDKSFKLYKEAVTYQQECFALFPDWFLYTSQDFEYIKEKIGYSLFGPGQSDKRELTDERICPNIAYDKQSCDIIDNIYNKILEFGTKNNRVFLGVLYNVVYNDRDRNCENVARIPIFKIKGPTSTYSTDVVWYIDCEGRVYKSWDDYKYNNTLPKCVMILPKDGRYQGNPYCRVTKDYAAVWVEKVDSPAYNVLSDVLSGVDAASQTLGAVASIGIGVASLFTPIGPALTIAGLVTCGASGLWSIGRNTAKLVDLGTHKQNIAPTNHNAISAWLGIGTSVMAVGTTGGSALLAKAVARGQNIGTAARVAYNSVTIGNFMVNGIGIGYSGFHLINTYMKTGEVDIVGIIMFTGQVFFFTNAAMNVKLAHELIGASEGSIFEKFKSYLRKERFLKEYNRIIGNSCDEGGIIQEFRKIYNEKDFMSKISSANSENFATYCSDILIGGLLLVDPFLVKYSPYQINVFKKLGINSFQHRIFKELKTGLQELLKSKYLINSELCDVLKEMSNMPDAKRIMYLVVRICFCLITACSESEITLIREAMLFIWEYVKLNASRKLRSYVQTRIGSTLLYDTITEFVTTISDSRNNLPSTLGAAFSSFVYAARVNI